MKSLPLLLLFLLTGCANRATSPVSRLVIPRSCVTDMRFTSKTVCHPLASGSFSCNGLVVQAACVKTQKQEVNVSEVLAPKN